VRTNLRRFAHVVVAIVVVLCAGRAGSHAQSAAPTVQSRALETNFVDHVTSGTLFENVVAVLTRRYYDADFRQRELPALVTQYQPRAAAAVTLDAQRQVTFELLSHIPASHLGLLSVATHLSMMRDLESVPYPTLGFQIIDTAGASYASWVLEGGPASRAGLLTWDRIVSIDGTPVSESPLVDWRSDDAFITDLLDPPMHIVKPGSAAAIHLRVERRPNEFHDLVVDAASYSVFDAEAASVHVIERGGRHVGYIHLWNVPLGGAPELLARALKTNFKDCDAVVLDLRGRGGSASEIPKIISALKEDRGKRHRPIIALVDRQSRSAKDVIAYELKAQKIATLVGEPTAGAVVPAAFADVGHDTVLMFPAGRLAKYSDLLEHKPVLPDIAIARAGPFSAGQDPILEAGVTEALNRVRKEEPSCEYPHFY
jgi:carboxyl-terminal processing protease